MKKQAEKTMRTRVRKIKITRKVASVRESRLVLFGGSADPEVKESIRKAEISGRKTELAPRPSFDTGLGLCGKHICSCKDICKKEYGMQVKGAYPGDQGPTMGMSY